MVEDDKSRRSELDLQREADLKVIAALRKAGSNLSLPHRVEHHFVSFSQEGAEELRAWGLREGLEVTEVFDGEREGEPYYYLDFIIPTIPEIERIYADTSRFFLLAAKFSADYDGWGCMVVS